MGGREAKKREAGCMCVCAVNSGWTVHTAPAYIVPKNLPQLPGEVSQRLWGTFPSEWL